MPEQDAVLAITAGVAEMQPVLDLVWKILLPAFSGAALPEQASAAEKLQTRLQGMQLLPPKGAHTSRKAASLSRQLFHFEPNYLTLHSLSLDFSENILTYRLLGGGKRRGTHQLKFGIQSWVDGTASLHYSMDRPIPEFRRVATSGVWSAEDTFKLTLCQYETPFTQTLEFRFSGRKVCFDSRVNVDIGPLGAPQLVGKVA
jgi:hypothetical protein